MSDKKKDRRRRAAVFFLIKKTVINYGCKNKIFGIKAGLEKSR